MVSWPFGRGEAPIVTRLAEPADRPALAALLASAWRRHGMMVPEEQATLLSTRLSALALAGDSAVGFLGLSAREPCGEPGERWVDVVLASVADGHSPGRILRELLTVALPAARDLGATGLVCLCAEDWLRRGLRDAGFREADRVLSYLWSGPGPIRGPSAASLRLISAADAEAVWSVNAAAFSPLWCYDRAVLLSWLLTAERAVLAELRGKPAGFALTTSGGSDRYSQLIRVAVGPGFQGHGIGRQLVADAMRFAWESGADGLSLNTQASNSVARHLYESLGFRQDGPVVTVMVLPLASR